MKTILSFFNVFKISLSVIALLITMIHTEKGFAQNSDIFINPIWAQDPPELSTLVQFANTESEMRVVITRYLQDYAALGRRYVVQYSPVRETRFREFFKGWGKSLESMNFDALSHEGKIDYILLSNKLIYELERLDLDKQRWKEFSSLVPFAEKLRLLQETRFDRIRLDPQNTANTLDSVADDVESLIKELEKKAKIANGIVTIPNISSSQANRAANYIGHLQTVLSDWNLFYDGYDPLYSWWNRKPYDRLIELLTDYQNSLISNIVGITPGDPGPIIGDPLLEQGLQTDLASEMIPYNAAQLLKIGWRELKWTEDRMKEVSNDMGYGDDWQAALEYVKTLAPPPGEVPWVIFDIANYSKEYIGKMNNVTLPPLAEEIWRLNMQSPKQQLTNPFFSGGEATRVSYPTDSMSHKNKMMSMRGNTPSFNFPTVQHELIPGHHLQGFMSKRFNVARSNLNRTPFWGEGWAFYWETLLWDDGFYRNNADKIGMLFWRMHRAARIIFSLEFQLGNWSTQQCVDFLIERVGHEQANAEGEVRRSFSSDYYGPLYQLAYMIGGLQLRALHKELVDSGKMTSKEFHDAVLIGGRMPIEMVRARLSNQKLTRGYKTSWRWDDTIK
jgi:uncharacterized protein (DUF885 family)